MQELLTVTQTSRFLQMHPKTVYKLASANKIPHIRIEGTGIRFKKFALEKWLEEWVSQPFPIAEILPRLEISLDGLNGYDKLFLVRRTESMNGEVRWTYHHGSVTQRKTKRREVRYSIDFQVDGQRVRKVLKGVRSRAEAVKVLNDEVTDAHRGKYYYQDKKITFAEMADLYLEKYAKVKKRGWKRSDWVFLRRLKPYFGNDKLSKITPLMIEEYVAKRKEDGLKNSSINRELSCLRKVFNLAIDWGYLAVNPVSKVKSLSEKGSMRERILTEDEEVRLFDASAQHLKPMLAVAIYAGFRRGVIFNLKWINVDLEKAEIRITKK